VLMRIANSPRLLVVTALVLLGTASAGYGLAEHHSILDSLWWALMTATTVGYGDTYPTTEVGRACAVLLVLSMIVFFVPMVTAGFASKLIVDRDAFTHEEQEDIKAGIRAILERLDQQDVHPH
jgi:voltage-gated potassium channel